MNAPLPRSLFVPLLVLMFLGSWSPLCHGQGAVLASPGNSADEQTTKKDNWIEERDEQAGLMIRTRELTLYPQAEPRPALKYRLLPDDFDTLAGNAAIYYLKALGFLEQDPARQRLYETRKEASARAAREGIEYSKVPPEVWRLTPPDKLPLEQVKEHLQLTSFQPQFIREAARRQRFDMDRNFRDVDDPIGYLLPEIQSLRELARTQSLRCRVAIAEGRVDDAIAIIGQQYAMARHLEQDEFLVSNLVGMAIASIAWNDALYLVERPDAPNLYWAFVTMPTPLVDIRHSMATERQFLYQQLKVLREVDETPRAVGYWRDFVDRLLPQIGYLGSDLNLPDVKDDKKLARAAITAYVVAAYPGARDYLLDECKMSKEQVAAYPTTQVVFLAVVRYYDQWRDEYFKWMYLPYWQVRAKTGSMDVDGAMRRAAEKYGFCALPANLLLPAVSAARAAETRCDQTVALIQTVEAIRMYGAAHGGKLPSSLDELPVPAPIEPFTGKPVDYQLHGKRAILKGYPTPGMQYRLILRFAKPAM